MRIKVIGAGLAGCEAAYQIAKRGIEVELYEMKPGKRSPAHAADTFAELVCSNSLRSNDLYNAVGLLKEEMRRLDSLILRCADETAVPAGGALAVNRHDFSRLVTERIASTPGVTVKNREVTAIPEGVCVISTGPLTDGALLKSIADLLGEEGCLHFFDAAAPIVTHESLNILKTFTADRYGRGESDYLNCPMEREEYDAFYSALVSAETVVLKNFERDGVFEGCMPVEVMASRGRDTLRYGPLKPVGLTDPATGKKPYAVVQLRKENREGTLYNLVGFQTHLTFAEQRRVFSLIPALAGAEFMRYGVMHRNTFINAPRFLNRYYQMKSRPELFFAGQITGVEGYVESASSGLVAGLNAAQYASGKPLLNFTADTATGALQAHVGDSVSGDYQPMNVNFGILSDLGETVRDKRKKREMLCARALEKLKQTANDN